MLLLLISVDGLVAPGIISSNNIAEYNLATCQHVDWNHWGINTYCRIQNCSCNNSGDCLHKYVGHQYGEDNVSQSVSGTLDWPRVVAPSKTCDHVRSSRRRWRWAQCRPRSAALTFGRVVLAGASTPAWCPVYRLCERPQPGVVRSGLVSLPAVAARDQKWRVAIQSSVVSDGLLHVSYPLQIAQCLGYCCCYCRLHSCSDHRLVDILARFTSRVPDIVQCMWFCANVVAVVRGIAVWKLSRRRFVTSVYKDDLNENMTDREELIHVAISTQYMVCDRRMDKHFSTAYTVYNSM